MNLLQSLQAELAELDARGLRRQLRPLSFTGVELQLGGHPVVNFCSNDYLGFGQTTAVPEPLPQGAGASRLISGNHPAHGELEAAIATWLGTEAALLFGSGYQANLGLVSGIAGPGDLLLSDALNHASLIDGCRLSRAKVAVFDHGNLEQLETILASQRGEHRRCFILSESLFSMDGDQAPLAALARLAQQYDAGLILDEAHAIGALGARGVGLATEAFAKVGTFGKAVGTYGAFVAGPRVLIDLLLSRARSFVFSTALPPRLVAETLASLHRVVGSEGDARRQRLADVVKQIDDQLAALALARSGSHIVPLRVRTGRPEDAMRLCQRLLDRGVFVQGIRPPTVPQGTARLRLSLSAAHRPEHIAALLPALAELRDDLL